jgi:hypothetical protein
LQQPENTIATCARAENQRACRNTSPPPYPLDLEGEEEEDEDEEEEEGSDPDPERREGRRPQI